MKLHEAINRLCALEMEIAVDFDDLPEFRLLSAWPFWPPGGNTTLETPCTFHTFRLRSKDDGINGLRTLQYEIGIQVVVAPSAADSHVQSERALGVHEAYMDALSARLQLGDGGSYTNNLRSENGVTLARLDWPPESGMGYVGLDYTLDLYLRETQLVGPG